MEACYGFWNKQSEMRVIDAVRCGLCGNANDARPRIDDEACWISHTKLALL